MYFTVTGLLFFTRQVVEINWPIKFNDKRIMKTGHRNPNKSREVSINYHVLWLESTKVGGHFISFAYFTQYQQSLKQSSNQLLISNPSF